MSLKLGQVVGILHATRAIRFTKRAQASNRRTHFDTPAGHPDGTATCASEDQSTNPPPPNSHGPDSLHLTTPLPNQQVVESLLLSCDGKMISTNKHVHTH